MVDWHRFRPTEWDIEYDTEKLEAHGIVELEAAEVIWNNFLARPNKKAHGPNRYELLGRTDAGRILKLIIHVSGERSMRVITGWRV
ncbi:MAG: hypothetical protein QOK37_2858 [Thermoanaerobaculia bacterium]|nr:hypothetical protein [Thermoanaerobaculia bacterium]